MTSSIAQSPSAPSPLTGTRIVATRAGGPEVLELQEFSLPTPGPGQLLVEVAAAGVNFIDTYLRSGVYRMDYPGPMGFEGAGTVIATGSLKDSDSPAFTTGDTVAWASSSGSYASHVLVDAETALTVPADIDLTQAAAVPLQGLTAHYLAHSSYSIKAGDWVLIHAGAGGVGLLLTQMAVGLGATVVTTVSTQEKEDLSRAAGAQYVIRYDQLTDMTAQLPGLILDLTKHRVTDGRGPGVDAVYDGVGLTTFNASLASLRKRGFLVLFGGASGQVPPFDLQRLNAAGSISVVRPTLGHYTLTRTELDHRAKDVFGAMKAGRLNVRIGATYPLASAGQAQAALESRATTGKVILIPEANWKTDQTG